MTYFFSELGCGTGVVGLVAAKMGAKVRLTDLEVYLQPVKENIEANRDIITKGEAIADTLDWGEKVPENLHHSADIILISDCIYYEMSLEPLISVMNNLVHSESVVILSYEERPEKLQLYETFFKMIRECYKVLLERQFTIENGNKVSIIKMTSEI